MPYNIFLFRENDKNERNNIREIYNYLLKFSIKIIFKKC